MRACVCVCVVVYTCTDFTDLYLRQQSDLHFYRPIGPRVNNDISDNNNNNIKCIQIDQTVFRLVYRIVHNVCACVSHFKHPVDRNLVTLATAVQYA